MAGFLYFLHLSGFKHRFPETAYFRFQLREERPQYSAGYIRKTEIGAVSEMMHFRVI
jgi:hypothetical protein